MADCKICQRHMAPHYTGQRKEFCSDRCRALFHKGLKKVADQLYREEIINLSAIRRKLDQEGLLPKQPYTVRTDEAEGKHG